MRPSASWRSPESVPAFSKGAVATAIKVRFFRWSRQTGERVRRDPCMRTARRVWTSSCVRRCGAFKDQGASPMKFRQTLATLRSPPSRRSAPCRPRAGARARPRTIRPRPSRWWCRSRPAAATTPWGASWPTGSAPVSARPWWSRTAAPAPASSAPARWSRRAPDGYTLMLGHTGSIGINPTLYVNAGFDPRKDFTPLGLIAQLSLVLLVHPSVKAKDVSELIALAKANPGKFNFASSALGTGSHMCAEMFRHEAGVDHERHSLQGHGATGDRSGRRPCAGLVRGDHAVVRQHQGRQPARAGGDQPEALVAAAGRADGLGVRACPASR